MISTWVGYIDRKEPTTIEEFEAEYPGTTVDYNEDVNDNQDFFGKVQPLLDDGESGGRDIMVVTDWMAKQMYDLGYLQEINLEDMPNVEANLIDYLRSPPFDPDRTFSVPWQSGMAGLIVNKRLAPDIDSVNDLLDPKYEGQVTVLTEMRDTVPLMMLADGVDPLEATNRGLAGRRSTSSRAIRLGATPPLHRQRLHPGPDQRERGRGDRAGRATSS